MKFRKSIFIFLMLSSILSFFGCKEYPKENNISVVALHELSENDDVIVFDVRTPEEILEGKIKSTALEADFFDADFLEKATAQISKDTEVYVYCRGGNRSTKAVAKLRELGYDKVYNIEGGIKAWKAAGYLIEK